MKLRIFIYPLLLALAFSTGIYLLFFDPTPSSVTPNHVELSLRPTNLREQNDLILAQEQEAQEQDQPMQTGPLLVQMNPTEAQLKVLNLWKK